MSTVQEVSKQIADKSGAIQEFVAKIVPDAKTGRYDDTALKSLEDMNSELEVLQQTRAELARVEQIREASLKSLDNEQPNPRFPHSSDGGGDGRKSQERSDTRSIGERVIQSEAYQDYLKMGGYDLRSRPMVINMNDLPAGSIKTWTTGGFATDGGMKTTMTESAGWAPFIPRTGLVIPIGQIQPVIADLIPSDMTNVPGTKYMEETTYTNNAATVAEGATKPESAFALTERTVNMAKIATTLPVTDEQLADVPQVRAYLDNRLALQIRQKEDYYLLSAASSPDGFDGFLVKSGVQTAAQGAVPIPTAVLSMMTNINFSPGFANVTGIVMNPLDWLIYVQYQTTIGSYVIGSPTDTAITTMWGMPIVRTNRLAQGTILLGDFQMFSHILRREELRIDIGWINDDFTKNLQRLRAEERMVLEIYRAAAFGTVTSVH